MGGIFACPECGEVLAIEGLTPGREVQCAECSTWVEVPYIPRATDWQKRGGGGRRRAKPAWASKWIWVASACLFVALLILIATTMIGSRARSDRHRVLNDLVASADRAEAEHDDAAALYQVEAALVQARAMGLKDSKRLNDLIERRDQASIRDARARLKAIDGLEPNRAVGESLVLEAKAQRDEALAPLALAIDETLARSRLRQAEDDLKLARLALESGRGVEAFEAADRLYQRADRLPDALARKFLADAQGVVEAVVTRFGVVIEPVTGRFLTGSPLTYAAALDRQWTETLKSRGFLFGPKGSPWVETWEKLAPFRALGRVVETQEGFYVQSKNRTTQIEGNFELTYQGRKAWQTRVLKQTREPLPDLPAYLAGHLATGGRRNPEVERLLYNDAFKNLVEQATKNFRGIPYRSTIAKD